MGFNMFVHVCLACNRHMSHSSASAFLLQFLAALYRCRCRCQELSKQLCARYSSSTCECHIAAAICGALVSHCRPSLALPSHYRLECQAERTIQSAQAEASRTKFESHATLFHFKCGIGHGQIILTPQFMCAFMLPTSPRPQRSITCIDEVDH
jgi:hypothetical protein